MTEAFCAHSLELASEDRYPALEVFNSSRVVDSYVGYS
jgi:hypothetical protein